MRVHEPLVGRDDALDALRSAATEPSTEVVVVSADTGLGRTRLLREAERAWEASGHPVITVRGTAGASHVPFGAFARVLPAPRAEPGSQAHLISELLQVWSTEDGNRRVVAVDDVHLLDAASMLLLHEVLQHGAGLVVITFPAHVAVPAAVTSLWKDHASRWLTLEPLGFDATTRMVAGMLDGPVDGSLGGALTEASAGAPLWIRELLLAARSADLLEREPSGLWRLTGPLPLSARLEHLVGQRLDRVSQRAREAAQVVALAEDAVPLSRLLHLVDLASVTEAERCGLLRLDEQWVTLAHPLHGTLLRQSPSVLNARWTYSRLARAVLDEGAPTDTDVLQVARWQHAAGETSDAALLTRAAVIARDRSDHEQAWALARRAGADDADADFDPISVAGEACLWTRRLDRASHYFQRAGSAARTPTEHARSMIGQAAAVFMGTGRTDHATGLLERACSMVGPADQEWHAAIALHGSITLGAGRVGDALDVIAGGRRCLPDQRPSPMLLSVQVSALTWSGRMAEAAELAEDVSPPLLGIAALDCLDQVVLATALSYLGRRDAALARAQRGYRRSLADGSTETRAMWAFASGNAELVSGHLDRAVPWLLEATTLMRSCNTGLGPASHARCLAELAHSLAGTGDVEGAEHALGEARELPLQDCLVPALSFAQAHVDTAKGDTRSATSRLRWIISRTEETGGLLWTAQGLLQLVLATRSVHAADHLASVAASAQGPIVPAWTALARSFVDDDPDGLADVASTFTRFGHTPLAAWALDVATGLFRDQGRIKQALLAAHARDQLAVTTSFPAETSRADHGETGQIAPLTPRERGVVDLVVSGLTAAEVARQLGHSRRTTESHLQHAYDKLGVHSRAELVELMRALRA